MSEKRSWTSLVASSTRRTGIPLPTADGLRGCRNLSEAQTELCESALVSKERGNNFERLLSIALALANLGAIWKAEYAQLPIPVGLHLDVRSHAFQDRAASPAPRAGVMGHLSFAVKVK